MRIIVIGANASGAAFLTRMRRLDEKADITVYEKSSFVSSSTCSLPYFIAGDILDASLLSVQTPLSLERRFNVKVKINHEVVYIDRKNKRVEVVDKINHKKFFDNYDKLVIATGSSPIVPSFVNIKSKRIFTLRNIDDAVNIRKTINENNIKRVAVLGGGYIGLEIAESLKRLSLDVDIFEMSEQVLNNLDNDVSTFIKNELIEKGVKLHLGKAVKSLDENSDGISVKLIDKEKLDFDLVILALGVKSNSSLARESGLELDIKNSIQVNSYMQTSDENIYAIGDIASSKEFVSNESKFISLANKAVKDARTAANHIKKIDERVENTLITSIVKVFSLTIASTGINEKEAKTLRKNYEKVIISPLSNLALFSGETMLIKVLYDKDDLSILGGQIVSKKGVDKRIDVLATAIMAKLKINQLKNLYLSYAPDYSSPKDPINMVGYVADNLINGLVKQYYFEDLDKLDLEKVELLDVRTKFEFNSHPVSGFKKNIPVDELRDRLHELDKKKKIYLLCHSAIRSYIAYRILTQNGFDCFNLAGGYYLFEAINRYK